MAYVAVQGGKAAMEASNELLSYSRIKEGSFITIEEILSGMKSLIDQVMSESSLYDEKLAALAIKQAEGSMEEAVFLLRAHRSTLPRFYYTTISDTRNMFVKRRITASFKDIPGGQLLGKTTDFRQRFLDFDLAQETSESVIEKKEEFEKGRPSGKVMDLRNLPKVVDYLASEGLFKIKKENNRCPMDITKRSIQFPSQRSERLQALTRGQTGAVTSLGYAELRGFGMGSHPNIGELRVGEQPLYIADIFSDDERDDYYFGSITLTEVESFITKDVKREDGRTTQSFEIGYGLCYGQNETKAIAMSILDYALERQGSDAPTSNDEFVLLHIDAVESSGFISHLKLPHYVTFQSVLDSVRSVKKARGEK